MYVAQNRRRVGDVFQHFHAGDGVEGLAARDGVAAGLQPVFHHLPGKVRFCRLQRACGEVNADDGRATLCQRLAQNAAAAADVKQAQPAQFDKALNEL